MELFKTHPAEYYQYRRLRGSIIALEGLISAGKTTLGKHIESYLNGINIPCRFFPEYVNPDLLDQFIKNMKKYAYSFQMIMLCKRIEIYRQALEFSKLGGVAIIDRSLWGDMTFAKMQHRQGNISDEEWDCYCSMVKHEIMIEPDVMIYLDCNIETSMARLKNRGNRNEVNGYSSEYLKTLDDTYKEEFQKWKHSLIVMDWNHYIDWKNDTSIVPKFIQCISEFASTQ